MNNTETHYVTYDPEEIYREMLTAYVEAGGDVLYPGDEKEILLRSVQAVMVRAFAGVDNALRMATLRYAVGDYLDLYGEKRNCYRIQAQAATATVEIVLSAADEPTVIPAGTALTADGEAIYVTKQSITVTNIQQTIQRTITAQEPGNAGNGLTAGTQMQFMVPQANVVSIYCTTAASGGQEMETDEAYRERIRTFGLQSITTGPAIQYEAAAKKVSSGIIDAKAQNLGAGQVGIALIISALYSEEVIIDAVTAALNARDVRPLTDTVSVYAATNVPYKLVVQYQADPSSNAAAEIAKAVGEYRAWQDNTIGRAFNPDRLIAAAYQAGATRVAFGAESNFDGGTVQYTEIEANERCVGTITIEVLP